MLDSSLSMHIRKSPWRAFLFWLLCYHVTLITAAHVQKELTVTWELGAPNGQERYMVKVNGQFPGPSLVFDEDDDVEVCTYIPFDFVLGEWELIYG